MEDEDFLHTTQARKCLETSFSQTTRAYIMFALYHPKTRVADLKKTKFFFGKNMKEDLLNAVFGDQMDDTLLGDKN